MLLLDLGQIFFQKEDASFYVAGKFLITTSYYERYKILSEKGSDEADFKFQYNTYSRENITNIKASCYNLEDGQIKKIDLKPSDIHTSKLSEHVSEVAFSVPGVKKGSVFEMSYSKTEYLSNSLPTWTFTSSIPSVKSSVTIGFLDAIDYYIDRHILTKNLDEKSVAYSSDIYIVPSQESGRVELIGKAVTYTSHDLPAFKTDDFTNSSLNYTSWIGFQLRSIGYPLNRHLNAYDDRIDSYILNSFDKLNEYFYGNPFFTGNLQSEPISKKLWEPLINDSMSEEHKTSAIFDLIRSNMACTSSYAFVPASGNNQIWKNKTGSSTEINILLINTLHRAGIKAYPMLVGSRSSGYINRLYPITDKFREIVALVELDNGKKKIVLDASDKFLPLGVTKFDLLNTYGLVLKARGDSYWYPIFDKCANSVNVLINASIDENSRISGEITIASSNYSANRLRRYKANNKEGRISDILKKEIPNATIESVTDTVNFANSRFTQKVKFSAQPLTDNDGNIYISIPMIYGDPTNPFVNSERTSDIDFGFIEKENVVMNLSLPSGYQVDSLVPPIKLIMPDTSISFVYQTGKSETNITLTQKIQYNSSYYKRENYPSFYDFHQKYYDLRQKPIILKKKA